MLTEEEEFEALKKHYIMETSLLLKAVEAMQINDVRQPAVKARIALLQAESATSFMELCRYILSLDRSII